MAVSFDSGGVPQSLAVEGKVRINLNVNKLELTRDTGDAIREALKESAVAFKLMSAPHVTEERRSTFTGVKVAGHTSEKDDSSGVAGKSTAQSRSGSTAPPGTHLPTFDAPAVTILTPSEQGDFFRSSDKIAHLAESLGLPRNDLEEINGQEVEVQILVSPNGLCLEGRNGVTFGAEICEIHAKDKDSKTESLLAKMKERFTTQHPDHVMHFSLGRGVTNLVQVVSYAGGEKNRVVRAFNDGQVSALKNAFKEGTSLEDSVDKCLRKLTEIKQEYVQKKRQGGKEVSATVNPFLDILAVQEICMDVVLADTKLELSEAEETKARLEEALKGAYENYMQNQPEGSKGHATELGGEWGAFMHPSKFKRAHDMMQERHKLEFEKGCLMSIGEVFHGSPTEDSGRDVLREMGLSVEIFQDPDVKASFCRQLEGVSGDKEGVIPVRSANSEDWPEFQSKGNKDNLAAMVRHMSYQKKKITSKTPDLSWLWCACIDTRGRRG